MNASVEKQAMPTCATERRQQRSTRSLRSRIGVRFARADALSDIDSWSEESALAAFFEPRRRPRRNRKPERADTARVRQNR
jgi:hypothetical protein